MGLKNKVYRRLTTPQEWVKIAKCGHCRARMFGAGSSWFFVGDAGEEKGFFCKRSCAKSASEGLPDEIKPGLLLFRVPSPKSE